MNMIMGGNYIPIKSTFNINDEINKYFTVLVKAQYPKYNIIYIDNNNIYIEIAVAGFKKHNLNIIKNECEITIIGHRDNIIVPGDNSKQSHKYLIKNISNRNFSLCFSLKPSIYIKKAHLEDGMLYVYLQHKSSEYITIPITDKLNYTPLLH